ncbi:hypothetical protein YC2023_025594 [Brassica napus]
MKLNSSVQIISSAMSLPLLLRTLLLTPPSPSQLQAVAALTGSGGSLSFRPSISKLILQPITYKIP